MYTQTELEALASRKEALLAEKANLKAVFNTQVEEINKELKKISKTLYHRKHYTKKHGELKISSRKDWTPEQLREYNRIKKQESRMRKTSKGE